MITHTRNDRELPMGHYLRGVRGGFPRPYPLRARRRPGECFTRYSSPGRTLSDRLNVV